MEVRKLIIEIANTNIGWDAPRIHGELRKLGIDVAESTVSKYMPIRGAAPGSRQSWRTFLANHKHQMLAIDFAALSLSLAKSICREMDRHAEERLSRPRDCDQ